MLRSANKYLILSGYLKFTQLLNLSITKWRTHIFSDNKDFTYFSLWVGNEPSIYEKLSYLSLSKNVNFYLYSYSEYDLPSIIKQISAHLIVPESEFKNFNGTLAEFSDYFRYVALSKLPLYYTWVDGDVLFTSGERNRSKYLFGLESTGYIGNAILRIPNTSKIFPELIKKSIDSIGGKWGATGPKLFTEIAQKYSILQYALRRDAFYAMDIHQVNLLIDPKLINEANSIFSQSIFVHFYSQMLRIYHIPRKKLPPKGSFLAEKFKEFAPEIQVKHLSLTWLVLWRIYFKIRTFIRVTTSDFRKSRN